MKKIFRTTFALAAIAAFVSCAEEINNPVTSDQDNADAPSSVELVPMVFSTSPDEEIDVKTTYKGRIVYWEETDKISVFSMGTTVTESDFTVTELSEDKTGARFEGLADPNASTYYAVYPYSEINDCDADGKLTVNIPSVQTAVASGIMSGANTSVAYSEESAEGNVLKFRNISALLCISFATEADAAATKSVTVKAKKNETDYWGLTGTGRVGFDDSMTPVIEEGNVEYVTLTAPEGGFVKGKAYFMPVYAVGDVDGIEVIYLGQDDKEYVKTRNVAATLERNVLFNLSAIPDPYLPEVVEFTINFDSNPFNENLADPTAQSESGETYTYNYVHNLTESHSVTMDLNFVIRRSTADGDAAKYYAIENGAMVFYGPGSNNFAYITLPAIPGRYLSYAGVGATKKMTMQSKATGSYYYNTANTWQFPIASPTASKPSSMESLAYLESEMGKSFVVKVRYESTELTSLTLRYTKEKPTVTE